MNPLGSFAAAFPGRIWIAFGIYMVAPPPGMLAAAEIYLRTKGLTELWCTLSTINAAFSIAGLGKSLQEQAQSPRGKFRQSLYPLRLADMPLFVGDENEAAIAQAVSNQLGSRGSDFYPFMVEPISAQNALDQLVLMIDEIADDAAGDEALGRPENRNGFDFSLRIRMQ